ncbi:MAG: TlpA disulfide reductase family protein [Bacteroidales bacterium]|nr:TlpA disulfide reductase family protein [Bacteroidales bacterium]
MLRFALLASLIALCSACGPGKGKFTITSEIKKLQHAELLIYAADGSWTKPDTMHIIDGRLDYTGRLTGDEPQIVRISFQSTDFSFLAIAESNTRLRIEGEATQLARLRVLGSEQNQRLTDFRLFVADKTLRDQQMAAAEFIRKHINQAAGVAAFVQYFAEGKDVSVQLATSVAKELRAAHPSNAWVATLTQQLEAQWRNSKGEPLPNFTLTTHRGRTVTKADYTGKPFAIVVWASWNNKQPSYTLELRRYAPQLAQLHLSLDVDSAMAHGIIARDSITAPIVMDRKGLASPIVAHFGISQVPTCLLIDKHGRIVARDIPAEQLQKHVQQLTDY